MQEKTQVFFQSEETWACPGKTHAIRTSCGFCCHLRIAESIDMKPFALPRASYGYALHDQHKGVPWKYHLPGHRIKAGHFIGAGLKDLLVEDETVTVPSEQLYGMLILGKEDEYIPAQWIQSHLVSHQLIQSIGTIPHINKPLAEVVARLVAQRKHGSPWIFK